LQQRFAEYIGEADPMREAHMSEALLTVEPAHVAPARPATDLGKEELKRVIKARAVLGYSVESLTDTRAVLVVKGRKRSFWRGGLERRTEVTIDDEGRTVTRDL
jgi:hypothetical protein